MSRPPKLTAARTAALRRALAVPAPMPPKRPPCAPLPLEREHRSRSGIEGAAAEDLVRWACACGDRGYWLSPGFADVAAEAGRSHVEFGTEGSNPPPDEDV